MITLLLGVPGLDDGEVEVQGTKYRHLFRARRLKLGARVRLVDGRGHARFADVVWVGRERATLRPTEAAPSNEPALRLELAVGALRPERASWLVEKGTELGVAAVHFLRSERSPRTYGSGTFTRLRRVAEAAVEQCGRSRVPELTGLLDLTQLADRLAAGRAVLLDGAAPRCAAAEHRRSPLLLVVGPEGGFTPAEHRELVAAGCRPLGLGDRVLRVETAAIVGSALFLCGDD